MKNKKFTYLLLVCVAGLWGLIFYRVFNSMASEDMPIVAESSKKQAYFKMVNHTQDQVDLKLAHRNPFSNVTVALEEPIITTTAMQAVVRPPVKMNVKIPVKWSAIQYMGYIDNPMNKKRLAMLTLDGKEFMLTEGQQLNGIKLIKYAEDSIKLQYQNETRYIKLR
jgi:hypothetical protein